jgi:TolB-like protein/DNA-binding winged helix-turn-helix (wHTH) protein/Flp pilus assembly protein TadD
MPMPAKRCAFEEFVLDPAQQRVMRRDGTPLRLTPRLFSALSLMVEHAGELLEKEWLMQALWPGLVVEENNLSQVVSGLRRALGEDGQDSRFIETVPRRGFRFIATVTPLADDEGAGMPAAPANDGPVPALPEASALPGAPAASEAPASASAPFDAPPLPDAPARAPADTARRRLLLGTLSASGVAGLFGAGAWMWRAAPGVSSVLPVLAVMPFKQVAATERDDLLEMGMADSLITRLSAVPGLVVRSTGAVRRYAGREQDPLRAARELDVTWIVDGSVQRSGDQVRITARLLSATDGRALWTGRFDDRYTGVFEVQDRISTQVVQALAPELRLQVSTLAPVTDLGGTHSPEAYQLYLAAMRRSESGRADGLREAATLYQRALAIDPVYASAWVGLAWTHRRRVWNADAVPGEAFDKSSEALRQALDRVPGFVPARAAVATTMYFHGFDWPGAEREFLSILAVSPNQPTARWDLALLMLTQGRIEAGFEQLRIARELEPTSPVLNAIEASFLIDAGHLASARLRLGRAFDFAPNLWISHVALGLLQFAEAQPEQGIASFRRAVELADATMRPKGVLAFHLAKVGRADEARAILGELLALERVRFVPPTTLAMVHAAVGEHDAALAQLERGLEVRDIRMIYLKNDPSWAVLRRDARFQSLLAGLALDRYAPGLTPI